MPACSASSAGIWHGRSSSSRSECCCCCSGCVDERAPQPLLAAHPDHDRSRLPARELRLHPRRHRDPAPESLAAPAHPRGCRHRDRPALAACRARHRRRRHRSGISRSLRPSPRCSAVRSSSTTTRAALASATCPSRGESVTSLSLDLNGGAGRFRVSGGSTMLVEAHSPNEDLRLRRADFDKSGENADVRIDHSGSRAAARHRRGDAHGKRRSH